MKATEYAKLAMDNSKNWAMGLIMDMAEAPLTQPTANGGNHPLWVLGHLAYSESMLFDVLILGQESRFPELGEKFGMSSQPTTNAADYPPLEELAAKFETIRAASLAHLASLSDDDLDKPSHASGEMAAFFGTVGACFVAMSNHVTFHAGQVADARRAAGRTPLMA